MSDTRGMKIEAARAALGEVESGMTLGLGTGTTAEEFIQLLARELREGELRDVRAVCTSDATEHVSNLLGISTISLAEAERIDLTIDGADEIDPQLRLIKGRGGALLREKVVEQSSRRFLVIADHTKLVPRLGSAPLPVEIVRFAAGILVARIRDLGLDPQPRYRDDEWAEAEQLASSDWDESPELRDPLWFETDEGHYILDVHMNGYDVPEMAAVMRGMAGVVETGYFATEATEAIVAGPNGIQRMKR